MLCGFAFCPIGVFFLLTKIPTIHVNIQYMGVGFVIVGPLIVGVLTL